MKTVVRGLLLAPVLGTALPPSAQVLTPAELPDIKTQRLQQKYFAALVAIGKEVAGHKFPYPFYFSRILDIDQMKMPSTDQRSIRFDIYQKQTTLEITGNYYASYSADHFDSYARLKETFQQVIMPLLQAAVPHFPDDSAFSAFAIEVSHHVREKSMGISAEHPENVTVIIPVLSAQKLVDARTDGQRQAAILEAQVFLNGAPYSLWLQEGTPPEEWKETNAPRLVDKKQTAQPVTVTAQPPSSGAPTGSANLMNASASNLRIFTQEDLARLQRQNEYAINRMTRALDHEARFLAFAPPSFIGFRHGAYLQLSITTQLNSAAGASRYKLTALAFDDHISHLVRRVLDYFPGEQDFDGINFSSVIHPADGSSVLAVEFFFPFRMMRCFASYDCTGQQLIDSGTLVINGERSALDLQVSEGKN